MTNSGNDARSGGESGTEEWIEGPDENLERTVIAISLIEEMKRYEGDPDHPFDVIIDLNLTYHSGRQEAKEQVAQFLDEMKIESGRSRASDFTPQYYFATLTAQEIRSLAKADEGSQGSERAIYKIWLDHPVKPLLTKSVKTVKGDAARVAFAAVGAGITWAVIDSGIEKDHPHFQKHKNLVLPEPTVADEKKAYLKHQDFTTWDEKTGPAPLVDRFGHGTHVAGIIAGEVDSTDSGKGEPMKMVVRELNADQEVVTKAIDVDRIAGVAPECKLLSLKVLDEEGRGGVSNIIEALGYVQTINEHGRWLHVQGVNLSVGYDYKADWFACGQSPLCVEVDRLVHSGVVVVVAAGNTGYGFAQSQEKGVVPAGLGLTINDPGNAELAITVGATHREKPHIYGVSYFSSKGPTGDGRLKPDLVAPGEKVISCAAGKNKDKVADNVDAEDFQYVESSGTSMAAPHVSGAIAAFLSIRREFEGQPQRIKEIFLDTATDLGRERYFQGHGLVDLMRAIQSV
jgi:serine protease AprX